MYSDQLRVGRFIYAGDKKYRPKFPGYNVIEVLTKSSKFGSLSPYELKTDDGIIIENKWQFSKLYRTIPASKQHYSRFDHRIIWEWPAEKHVHSTGEISSKYYEWREAGFKAPDAIRYPVGKGYTQNCICSIDDEGNQLDYVEARKAIYVPLYIAAVKKAPQYQALVKTLQAGQKLLISEVDGPHQNSMKYYMDKYGVSDEFIIDDSMQCTIENVRIMLNDTMHSFGHGYCLAMALMGDEACKKILS